jgi:cobalamin biosynthesis protein CobW
VAAQRAADETLDHDTPLEELFEEQLACADMVIINKADLLDDAQLAAVEAIVARHLRPAVKILRASHGAIDIAVLLGLASAAEDDLDSRWSHHDAAGEHDHDDFTSFSVELGETETPDVLLARLRPVIAAHGVLRVKGFAAVTGKAMRLVVQGVGDRLQHYYDRDWRPDEARATRLVFIGETGLDEAAIRAAVAG